MNQLIALIAQHVARAAMQRPWLGMAIFGVAATAVTALVITQGARPFTVFLTALLWISALGLGLAGRTMQRHAAKVEHARSTGGVVPPPRWIVGNSFWFSAVFTLVVLVGGIYGINHQFLTEDTRERAVATVVDVQFSHQNLNNKFYDVEVQFTADDGEEVNGSFVKFGTLRIGDVITVTYESEDPDATVDEAPSTGLIAAIAIGGTTLGLIGLTLAWTSLPRRTDPNLTLARIPELHPWVRTGIDQSTNGEETHHLLYGDTRCIRVWTGGQWTIASLHDWLTSGGVPSDDFPTRSGIRVADVNSISEHGEKLIIEGRNAQGQVQKIDVKLGIAVPRYLQELAHNYGWNVRQRKMQRGGALGAYEELVVGLSFLSPLVCALGLLMVDPVTMNEWAAVLAVTLLTPAVLGLGLVVVGRTKQIERSVTGPSTDEEAGPGDEDLATNQLVFTF